MAGNATVKVFFVGDAKQLQGVMSDVGRDAEDIEGRAHKAASGFSGLQAALIGVGVGAGLKKVIGDASDLNETVSKTQTIFGSASKSVLEWSEGAAKGFGLSKNEALSAASTFGNMFDQLGIGMGVAKDMSTQMVQLASDFASFHNADTTDVIDAMTSAFRGEYDALQRFVPTINAAAVEQKALEMGLAATTKELDAQDKAIATQALIMENAGEAAGDFARTSDSLANKQRIMKAELANVSAELGTNLMPIATQVVGVITKMAEVFGALPAPLQQAVLGIGALAAGMVVAGKAGEHIQTLKGVFEGAVEFINKMRGAQEAATVATEAATAAEVANTVATEANTAAHASGAAAFGVAAGALGALALAGAAVYGTYQMMHDAMVTVDVDTQQMARNTNEQLVQAWQWASENAKKFNLDLDDFAAKVATNIGVATRMADALDAQGLSSEKLRAAIQAELEAEQRSADTKEVANQTTKKQTVSTKELEASLKDLVAAVKDSYDAIDTQADALQDAEDQALDLADSVAVLSREVRKNGTSMNVMTESGRAVYDALNQVIRKANEWLGTLQKSGASATMMNNAHLGIRQGIVETMRSLGFGVAAIEAYVSKWEQGSARMRESMKMWANYSDDMIRMQQEMQNGIDKEWQRSGGSSTWMEDLGLDIGWGFVKGITGSDPFVVGAIGGTYGGGGSAGDAIDEAGDELAELTKGGARKMALSFEEQLQADQLALNAVVDEVWGNVALSIEEKTARIKKAVEDAVGMLQIVPPLGEGNPDGVAASPANTLLNGATRSGGNVTVNVFSPTVQNPVTASSLAYSIGKQAAVAFAGAA